jgi:uncharacterized repeat protein (TIGR02543 family)
MAPGGNTTCNSATDLYNKYKPGGGGVGASSIANRRAKNRLATVCGSSNKCFPCYNTLGQYSSYTHNPNGFVPCPGTINIISSGSVTPTPTPTPPSTTYTLRYRNTANGGTEPAPTTSYSGGTSVAILGNTFTNTANPTYLFGGWNTSSDGTGTYYPAGSNLTMPYANTTLWAQWYNPSGTTYSVTYDGSGNTGGAVPSTVNYSQYQGVPISDNTGNLVRTGYTFYGWNTAPNGSGTAYSVTSNGFTMPGGNVTLYAQWVNTSTSYILTYDGSGNTGGSVPASTSYPSGAGVSVAGQVIERSGYNFLGWNTAQYGTGSIYQPGSSVVMNSYVTLYAQWVGGTLFRGCTTSGVGTTSGGTYIWGGQSSTNVYRDNTNSTITGIIQSLYNKSNIGPYGTGNGPSDTAHSGNIKSSLANVVLSQAGPTTYEINITYTAIYTGTGTDIPYTVTANLPLTTAYWPTGETFNTITTSISPITYTFGTGDVQGSPTSSITNGCQGGGSSTLGTPNITVNQIITTFYINFSNGTSTRIALSSTLKWTSNGATNPYTYVYNYTRVELASGPTSSIPNLTTNTTAINTPNV